MNSYADLPSFLRSVELSGLRPRHALAVGPGYGREEIKTLLFADGRSIVSEAMTRADELALHIVEALRGPSRGGLLSTLARQEGLRLLLGNSKVLARLPELRRLKRQTGFFRKLDRAMQAGRLSFAHADELEVLEERLLARIGASPLRTELKLLTSYYETWLAGIDAWDTPGIFAEATAVLLATGVPAAMRLPEKLFYLTTQQPDSREQAFWDALKAHLATEQLGPGELRGGAVAPLVKTWERWHTLDDAAEGLADRVLREASEGIEWREQAVLIPDQPAVRRSVMRALKRRRIPVADPRDPTRLRMDEALKWALLPLEVVARGFERQSVVAGLRAFRARTECPDWIKEINSRGIRQGLAGYAGGKLVPVHAFLHELQDALGGKRTCAELGLHYLTWLRGAVGEDADRLWILKFLESQWQEFQGDMERTEQAERRAPALYWLERFNARLEEASPPADRLKPESGVFVHRLGQAPIEPGMRLCFFGLPSAWIAGDGAGDYWFSSREREVLAGEFQVRSAPKVGEERRALLAAWIAQARTIEVLDAEYDWDGRERESLFPALRQLGLATNELEIEAQVMLRGAHDRFVPSFSAERTAPPLEMQLEPAPGSARVEISATALDQYSQCGIVGLAGSRWRVYDGREPGTDPWPEVRGDILHRAVRSLLTSRDDEGRYSMTVEAALEDAWQTRRPEGLLKGARLQGYVKQRLVEVLRVFLVKEAEFFERAHTRVIAKDDRTFRIEYDRFTIVGKPDRVDEHPAGLFIMDYKSGGNLPGGRDMIELGYRLQLPFYAIAASKELGKPAIGVQFIELNRKGARSKGIFFKAWNGKEPGKLTKTTANNSSLISKSPEETWDQVEFQLYQHAERYLAGIFAAVPKRVSDCADCRLSDLCGLRRRSPTSESSDEEAGE